MYGILIYDGVEPIDIGATYGVLSMAKRIAPDLEFAGVAKTAGNITCASGMRMSADYGIDDAPEFADLIVTGGPGWVQASKDKATLDYIRTSSARLTSICTGAMILAAAGVLAGRNATTKYEVFDGETPPADLLPGDVSKAHAAIVEDDGILTGGGVTLGIDTMFHCLARSHGEEVARETARVMEYTRALSANCEALGYHLKT
ncbi:MAG: DJ-1/PfpI family protein [Pseudomonadota bacterium]